jgi:hypothetical protein
MDKSLNFMSIENLQNLMSIFEKFMIERYSINIENHSDVKLKQIIYETMMRVTDNSANHNIPLLDLNKITLSIVKNVIKQKLSLDKSKLNNTSLNRDREVHKDKTIHLYESDRPQSSKNSGGLFSNDVNKQFTEISELRTNERESRVSHTPLPSDVCTDQALCTADFVKMLHSLEHSRDMKQTSYENDNVDKTWLSDIYKQNSEKHPKEFYNTTEQFMQLEDTPSVKNSHHVAIKDIEKSNNGSLRGDVKLNIPKTNKTYLIVDSRDRDIIKFPNPSEYIIELDILLRNILKIKFMYAQYTKPDIVGVDDTYVNLHIEEFDTKNISIKKNSKSAFLQLPLSDSILSRISGKDFIAKKYFQSPLNKLNKLQIKFTKYNEEVFENMTEHLLKFEITYIQIDSIFEQNVINEHELLVNDSEVIASNEISNNE